MGEYGNCQMTDIKLAIESFCQSFDRNSAIFLSTKKKKKLAHCLNEELFYIIILKRKEVNV